MRVPTLTVQNTAPLAGVVFHWITNYLETVFSTEGWVAPTSATIALQYRRIMSEACRKTNPEAIEFVKFQGHDFSMRGMGSIDAAINSGIGHASVFLGSDTLPVIPAARKYYNAEGMVVMSVNATEHSVMCAGGMENEIETFRELLNKYPTGILSIVSDTWDLWNVCTKILPALKTAIMARGTYFHPDYGNLIPYFQRDGNDVRVAWFSNKHNEFSVEEVENWVMTGRVIYTPGKVVIRPDSGDPVNIVCGDYKMGGHPRHRGVVELLWNVFGGTKSSTDYKVLDEHIGVIYGDSITVDRCQAICDGLESKGFASTNCVFGIGSYTYQCKTRDTFGFAMKATYCEVNGEPRRIFKDPITDDGTKKSAKGLLAVQHDDEGNLCLVDDTNADTEANNTLLRTIYREGVFFNETSFEEIRKRIDELV